MTIGTLDGANIEIRDEAGAENFFLFGLTEDEVTELKPTYNPRFIIDNDADLKRVVDLLESGHFNQCEEGCFDDIIAAFTSPNDPWMTVADFHSYVEAQQRAAEVYQDKERWIAMSIMNSANSGMFSTDRTMEEYNNDIWKLEKINPRY